MMQATRNMYKQAKKRMKRACTYKGSGSDLGLAADAEGEGNLGRGGIDLDKGALGVLFVDAAEAVAKVLLQVLRTSILLASCTLLIDNMMIELMGCFTTIDLQDT